ncbi:MAG: DUF1688 family protein [Bdellovibrio sp.]|nr:MAG: DUF1688 family protein [Bdellovibrio sp.]
MNDKDVLKKIFSAQRIREQAQKIWKRVEAGKGEWRVDLSQMEPLSEFVQEVILEKYPDLKIPPHSRLNHFQVGGRDRVQELLNSIEEPLEKARTLMDLIIVSVFLDAGAGAQWKYNEDLSGHFYSRSEGLAVASYHLFHRGLLSSDPQLPFQADGAGLLHLTEDVFKEAFQVSVGNNLLGVKERVALLHRLGKVVEHDHTHFSGHLKRPGSLLDYWITKCPNKKIQASFLLETLLFAFSPIWPQRTSWKGHPLGDVWSYSPLGADEDWESLVPFHKLSQWLAYSLFQPLEMAGFTILNPEALTGLPEYRNGGLFIDGKVLLLKDERRFEEEHPMDSDLVIEWRALTLVLLDQMAEKLRERLKRPSLTMAEVLEGGTWWAGRRLAFEKRSDGASPLKVISDGTVF